MPNRSKMGFYAPPAAADLSKTAAANAAAPGAVWFAVWLWPWHHHHHRRRRGRKEGSRSAQVRARGERPPRGVRSRSGSRL